MNDTTNNETETSNDNPAAEVAEAPTPAPEAEVAEAPTPAPKPKKEKKKGVGTYPFRTKKSILAQIAEDDGFAASCLGIIYDRQTSEEQEAKTTKSRNARGFMSSHAVRGSELALKLRSGEAMTDEDTALVRKLALSYGKQLAAHFRAEQIEANPELAAVAKVFSAG